MSNYILISLSTLNIFQVMRLINFRYIKYLVECEQNLGNNQIYARLVSVEIFHHREALIFWIPFFQQKHRMQASVYTSNVTRRQRGILSRDAGSMCTDFLLMLPVESVKCEYSWQSFSCDRLFHRPTDHSIKRNRICARTRKYGCINAENKTCMIPFWFASVAKLLLDPWIFHVPKFTRNIYTCRKTTEFVLLMIPWSGYCLVWRYKFLPRGCAETLDSSVLHVAWKSFLTMLCLQRAR